MGEFQNPLGRPNNQSFVGCRQKDNPFRVADLTHQALRRTSSTHIQEYASVKELQAHLRHTNPQTALKHYTKVIPETKQAAVAALDDDIATAANESK